MQQIDKLTHNDTTLVMHAAAATTALRGQLQELDRLMRSSTTDNGTRLIHESGELLLEIVNNVKRVTGSVRDIAIAMQKTRMSAGDAITPIDDLTRDSVASWTVIINMNNGRI